MSFFKTVFIIGAGGTGSHLISSLVRLLRYHASGAPENITVIDGDRVEPHNLSRQLFSHNHIMMDKVDSMRELGINTLSEYVDGERLVNLIKNDLKEAPDRFLVVMAVDNTATRSSIIKAIDAANFQNFVILDPGNNMYHGEVVVYVKDKGKRLTAHPFDIYPEISEPKDKIPVKNNKDGCHARVERGETQHIAANASAALCCIYTISAMLDKKPWFGELGFHSEKMEIAPKGDPIMFS